MDYTILHAAQDSDRAVNVHKLIQDLGYDGEIYTGNDVDELCERAVHMLFCISNNVGSDQQFLKSKVNIVQKWVKENRVKNRIIPVYLDNKKDLSDETYSYLYGLTSVNGFYPHSKYFSSDVIKQFNCRNALELKESKRHSNASSLANPVVCDQPIREPQWPLY